MWRANVSFFQNPARNLFRSLFLVRASFGSKVAVCADEIMVLQIFADFRRFRRFSQIFADSCRFSTLFATLAIDLIVVVFLCVSGMFLFGI